MLNNNRLRTAALQGVAALLLTLPCQASVFSPALASRHALAPAGVPVAPVAVAPRLAVPLAGGQAARPRGVAGAPAPDRARQRVDAFIRRRLGARAAHRYTDAIVQAGLRSGVPPLLVAKVVYRESSFRPHAHNRGCYGLMQVAAFHFKAHQNPCEVETNLAAGCRLLAGFHHRFGSWPQALTAYNYGPYAIASRGLGTSAYARQVLGGR